jgi:hypothetical protein
VGNATVHLDGVSVSVDVAVPGNKLFFADITPESVLAASTITASGPASLEADVQASVQLGSTTIDLGTARLNIGWTNIGDLTSVTVGLDGPITDMIGARVEQLREILDKIKALTDELDGSLPPDVQQGLDTVIEIVKVFDENVVQALQGSADISLQDVIELISTKLNQELGQFGISFHDRVLKWDMSLDSAGLGDLELEGAALGERHQGAEEEAQRRLVVAEGLLDVAPHEQLGLALAQHLVEEGGAVAGALGPPGGVAGVARGEAPLGGAGVGFHGRDSG